MTVSEETIYLFPNGLLGTFGPFWLKNLLKAYKVTPDYGWQPWLQGSHVRYFVLNENPIFSTKEEIESFKKWWQEAYDKTSPPNTRSYMIPGKGWIEILEKLDTALKENKKVSLYIPPIIFEVTANQGGFTEVWTKEKQTAINFVMETAQDDHPITKSEVDAYCMSDVELTKSFFKLKLNIPEDSTKTSPQPGHRFIKGKCLDCKQSYKSCYKTCQGMKGEK